MKKKKVISILMACTLLSAGFGNAVVLGEDIAVWDSLEGEMAAGGGDGYAEAPGTEQYVEPTESYIPEATEGYVPEQTEGYVPEATEGYVPENTDNFQEWTESYYYEEAGTVSYTEESYQPEERQEFWDEREAAYEEHREGTISKNSDEVYTVEDFDIPGIEEAQEGFQLSETSELPEQMYLQVPEILQNPELPTGCEAVSLTMALQYEDFDEDKITIASDFLIYNQETDNMAIGYVGDPFSESGAGCFAPAIAATALAFFTDQEAEYKAYDITDTDFEDLFAYIAAGTPVILWTTMYMADPEFTRMDAEYEGHVYRWYSQEHCVVLSGYNRTEGTVQVNDPLEGIVTRNLDEFAAIYNLTGKNAVVLKEITETTSDSASVNTEVGLP